VLDALYATADSRAQFAAQCEALAARARANAQAYLPTTALWATGPAIPTTRPPSPVQAADAEAALPGLRDAKSALEAAAEQLLRASDAAPDDVGAAVAEAVAKVELARSLLAFTADAACTQVAAAAAAAAELRGALEEALQDAREAEAALSAERERVRTLEAHLRAVLSARSP
jgi:hypothetical protein